MFVNQQQSYIDNSVHFLENYCQDGQLFTDVAKQVFFL